MGAPDRIHSSFNSMSEESAVSRLVNDAYVASYKLATYASPIIKVIVVTF